MPVLRLRQTAEGGDAYRVLLELEANGQRREDTRQFKFKLEAQDQEDLRWYLEDYLQYPLDPAPKIAARIEARMDEIGAELFGAVLAGTSVWGEARHDLAETRVEVVTGVQEATAIPGNYCAIPKRACGLRCGRGLSCAASTTQRCGPSCRRSRAGRYGCCWRSAGRVEATTCRFAP